MFLGAGHRRSRGVGLSVGAPGPTAGGAGDAGTVASTAAASPGAAGGPGPALAPDQLPPPAPPLGMNGGLSTALNGGGSPGSLGLGVKRPAPPRRPTRTLLWIQRFMVGMALAGLASLVMAIYLLERHQPERSLPERWFRSVPYLGMPSVRPDAPRPAEIYHVTREFGPAILGGMGAVVTELAQGQASRGLRVHVFLPFYTYLESLQPELWRTVTVQMRSTPWAAPTPLPTAIYRTEYHGVELLLVSPGTRAPLDAAFTAVDRFTIYSMTPGVPWETRDLLLCAIVAQALVDLEDELAAGPAPASADPADASVVHLHGATNAATVPMFHDLMLARGRSPRRTAFVYTLHDYREETSYHLNQVYLWLLATFPFAVDPTTHAVVDSDVFMSYYGISGAAVATCVSETLAADLVEGRQEVTNGVLVIDAIHAKARRQRFVGIPNGVDFGNHSAFNNPVLAHAGLLFDYSQSIAAVKAAAKHSLCRSSIVPMDACGRPMVLFIGRFQLNKGARDAPAEPIESCDGWASNNPSGMPERPCCARGRDRHLCRRRRHSGELGRHVRRTRHAHFERGRRRPERHPAARRCRYPGQRGAQRDARHSRARGSKRSPALLPPTWPCVRHIQLQDHFGPILRAAADVVFVPSRTEAFGLVAAEGLSYGSLVVTTGVGGLRDFLRDRRDTSAQGAHNAYFFTPTSRRELEDALGDALDYLASLSTSQVEALVRQLIAQAHGLRWDRQDGPLDRYDIVYSTALQTLYD